MTLNDFVAAVKAGALQTPAGGLVDGTLLETLGTMDAGDLIAVTAEAYNQDVFGPNVPWDSAYAQVQEALA